MLNEGEMLMKKSLIALAVAGAMTAPIVAQADATLYGSFRMSLMQADGADLDLRDEATRIGIKGDVDLGLEGTKGLFLWEAGVNTVDGVDGATDSLKNRLAYIGATGEWGTALVGKQYHPYYTMVNSHTNIFQGATGDHGEAFALGNKHHKRANNTLAYASPVMSGFQVVGGLVIASDGSDTNNNFDDDVDGYNIGAQFTGVEGLRVSASYGKVDTDVSATTTNAFVSGTYMPVTVMNAGAYESEIWGLGATYKIADFTMAAKYEEREDSLTTTAGTESDDFTVWEVAGVYQMNNTAFKARYGNIELKSGGDKVDGDQWALEVEQKLGSRGYLWVGYTDFDTGAAEAAGLQQGKFKVNATGGVDEVAISKDLWQIGYRLDF
jgi:predicted porin